MEILNGNQVFVRALQKAEPGGERVETHHPLLCLFLENCLGNTSSFQVVDHQRWGPADGMAEDDQIPFPETVPVVSGLPRTWQGLLKNGLSEVTKPWHLHAAFLSTLRVANPPSPSLSKCGRHPTKLHRFALESRVCS